MATMPPFIASMLGFAKSRRARAIVLSSFLWMGVSPTSLAEEFNLFWDFSSGNWTGGAYQNSQGAFSHCSVAAVYQSGIRLAFGITRDYQLRVVLAKAEWRLPDGAAYKVDLIVDGVRLGRFDASAARSDAILVEVGNRADIFKRLRHGHVLRVVAATDAFEFSLKGTFKALGTMKDCVDVAITFSPNNTNPFASSSTNPFAYGEESEQVTDEQIITILLEASGITEVTLVEPSRMDFKEAEYAWVGGEVYGLLVNVELKNETAENQMRGMVGALASECGGSFASQAGKPAYVSGSQVRQYYTACSMAGGTLYSSIISVAGELDVMYLINFTESSNVNLHDVGQKLTTIITALLSSQ